MLRATGDEVRALRLATLSRVRSTFPLLTVDSATSSYFARLANSALSEGRKLRRHDTWIAATALRHDAVVITQDKDFSKFEEVDVILV